MNKQSSDLKILLLQIREEEEIRDEELASFARFSHLSVKQFDILNVFDTPLFSADIVEPYDALFVGGASGSSVLEGDGLPFFSNCVKLLQYCIEIDKPVFASCYGFQLTVIALGGEIIRDEETFELGTPQIYLTESARVDPLFCNVTNPFYAVSVHHEKALALPACCELLAYTDICLHAFKVVGKSFWACQFHPEVDQEVIRIRLGVYKHIYTEDEEHYYEVINSVLPTPYSNGLLKSFINYILTNP